MLGHLSIQASKRDTRGIVHLAVVAAWGRDQNVEPPREDEAEGNYDQGEMGDAKAEDMQGVLAAFGVKGGIGKAVHDGQDRRGHVLDERTPEGGDIPVLAGTDNDVEVAAKLLGLGGRLEGQRIKEGKKKKKADKQVKKKKEERG